MWLAKCQLQTFRSSLEQRLGCRVPVGHPVMSWLVSHAADVRTFRVRGEDGTSAWQKVRGRPFTTRLLEFGEQCRFKLRAKEPSRGGDQLWRWGTGVFLGPCKLSGQYRIYSDGGIRMARTIKRLPDPQKWKPEIIQNITLTPWQVHAAKSQDTNLQKTVDIETYSHQCTRRANQASEEGSY